MKKIAILGASEPHLPLFLKAKEMGLETYCFAWSQGAYCKNYADHYYDISIVDKEQIAVICQKEKINYFQRIRDCSSYCSVCSRTP